MSPAFTKGVKEYLLDARITYDKFHIIKLINEVGKVIKAIDKLNSRPRKCLDWKTPHEVFEELSRFDARIMVQGIR